MTPDKIKNALISYLDAARPDPDITVSDAEAFDAVALPALSVGVGQAEVYSPVLPGTQRITYELTLRAHSKDDDSRATIETWCDEIEKLLNDPDTHGDLLGALATAAKVHYWRCEPGVARWDETTLEVVWSAECCATRTA